MNIVHQKEQNRFVAQLDGVADTALLTYQLLGNKTVNFNYSYVPMRFRGHGVAKELVDTGFDWARSEQLRITASCSYVAQFVPTHQD